MFLRRLPTLTPAPLAANRAHARESTRPRRIEGKNGIALGAAAVDRRCGREA
jgi:hypothetical protein